MIILLKMGDPLCRVVCRVIWTSTVESLHPKDELDSSKIEAVPLLILLTALTVLKLGRLFPLGSQVGVRGSRVCQFILVILCIYFIFIYSHWGVRGAGKQGFAIFDDGRGLTW